MTQKKIGIFGGSFDPVHRGHVALARAAQRELKLSRVYFVCARQSPFKEIVPASTRLRLAMLRLALADYSWAKLCHVELRRKGRSYTIDTVQYFKSRFPNAELFLLMGSDAANSFEEWKSAQLISKLCHLVVAARQGKTLQKNFVKKFQPILLSSKLPDISSTQIRNKNLHRNILKGNRHG